MTNISLNNVLPSFLSDTSVVSEIWGKDIVFAKGEYSLVTAVSGVGKSSLLSYIFGERCDFSGTIAYDGQGLEAIKADCWSAIRRRHISYVFQGLRLFSDLTALENVLVKNRLTQQKSEAEIHAMFDALCLADKKQEKAARLSFGQLQRVAIIRALCQPFDFLLLDEPFSHLDEMNISVATALIEQEVQSRKAGLLLCSLGQEYPFNYHHKFKL
ncbi:MAG: ATP-binding cassette domain-containing protein [Bacteroidales bacterium]|nr:ATP-binding cassette domain-containing protein [Bacteroidales bacterium]MCL2132779.1 ATP-binding cassette domain-containing protein [Bacteroidales bacterium]